MRLRDQTELLEELTLKNFASNEDQGGKIWLLWGEEIDVVVLSASNQFIHCSVKDRVSNAEFFASFIYAKCTVKEIIDLWQDLMNLAAAVNMPWMVGGDFNTILNADEKIGRVDASLISMNDFRDCVDACGLMDCGYTGSKFTWSNNQAGQNRVWGRWDRILVNSVWISSLPMLTVEHLPRISSDHSPLIASLPGYHKRGMSPFRFQRMWTLSNSFIPFVQNNRNCDCLLSAAMERLAFKVKNLRSRLKFWNKHIFGDVFLKRKDLEEKILQRELALQEEWTPELNTEINRAKAEYKLALLQEEVYWKHKSGEREIKEGKSNSKSFYALMKEKGKRRAISAIQLPDGSVVEDLEIIHKEAVKLFEQALSSQGSVIDMELLSVIPDLIANSEREAFTSEPTEEEVQMAVFRIPCDSAPGPYGIYPSFYQVCWDVVKEDLVLAAKEFFREFLFQEHYVLIFFL